MLSAESIAIQQELNSKLEKQQARVELIEAEKLAMQNSLQQEINRATSATAKLETELEQRQAEQQSLHDQISTASGEKVRLLSQLELEQKSRYESNWELSTAHGLAAVNYFQHNNQVDPKRMQVVGYGQYRLVSSNETAEGRELNRRIEIILLPPE